jgi:hypothetical protein
VREASGVAVEAALGEEVEAVAREG